MHKTLGKLSLAVSALAITGCGFVQPPPFDPRRMEKTQTDVSEQVPTPILRPLPTTLPALDRNTPRPEPTTRPIGPTVRMTLQEAAHRLVANNTSTRVAGYQAAIDESRILEAKARWDPTFFSTFQFQRQFPLSPTPQTLDPAEVMSQSLEFGFRQDLANGGTIEIKQSVQRSEFDRAISFFSTATEEATAWNTQIALQLTQPLLRGFGTDVNYARVTIARNDQKISEYEWRETLERNLADLEEAYWSLAFAQRDVEIVERLLADAQRTLDIIVARVGHDVGRVQVSQARSSVFEREVELVRARAQVKDLSDQVKLLMGDPDYPVAGPTVILAATEPVLEPVTLVLSEQMETAMFNRLELAQQALRIDSASTIVRAAKNNALPILQFVNTLAVQGLGDDFSQAMRSQADGDLISYGVGLQFEVPIGNRQGRAIYQRTLLQRQQSIEQYHATIQQISFEVTTAHRAVETAWNLIDAGRKARFAAEDALAAIEVREAHGEALTHVFVQLKLQRQEILAQARRLEVQAIVRYNNALSALERRKGTLLRYNNVVLKEEAGPMFFRTVR